MPQGGSETDLSVQANALAARKPLGVRLIRAAAEIAGVDPSTWFSPLQPIPPSAPPEAKGRQFDFLTGANIRIQPRSEEAVIGMKELRALADSSYLLRLVIETRKDQLSRLDWTIRRKDAKPGEESDDVAKEIKRRLAYPDRRHDFATWLRMEVEDMIALDASSLWLRKTVGGDWFSAEIIDGATLHPLIDQDGRTPTPPSPAYSQVIKGLPTAFYTSDELVQAIRNPRPHHAYGYGVVEQLLPILLIDIQRTLSKLEYYKNGSHPHTIISVDDASTTGDQLDKLYQNWNGNMEGNPAEWNKIQFMPKGTIFELKGGILKDDFDEWLARVFCYAVGVAYQPFVKEVNRGTGDTSRQMSIEEGMVPHMGWAKRLVDRLIELGMQDLKPNHELMFEEPERTDTETEMRGLQLAINAGLMTINEGRAKKGRPPVDGGDIPYIVTVGAPVPVAQIGQTPPAPAPTSEPKATPGATPEPAKVAKRARKILKPPHNPTFKHRQAALASHLHEFLRTQADRFATEIGKLAGVSKATGDEANIDAAIARLIDEGQWSQLYQVIAEPIEDVGTTQAGLVMAQLGVDDEGVINRANARVVAYARTRAAELVGMKLVDGELVPNPASQYRIDGTTRDDLRALVTKAVSEGMTPDQLSDAIRQAGTFSEARADMIAQTELAYANTRASHAAWKASGVVQARVWVLSEDHDEADECDLNANAGPVDLDRPFPSGDMEPPQHPRCQCGTAAVLEGDLD